MKCNVIALNGLLHIDYDVVDCEFYEIFVKTGEEYISVTKIYDETFATISKVEPGEGKVYVAAKNGRKILEKSDEIDYVMEDYNEEELAKSEVIEGADADGFFYRSAFISYKDMLRISWKFDERADGFEVLSTSIDRVLADVTNGCATSALINKRYYGESFYIRPYLNTLNGREYFTGSFPVEFTYKKDKQPKISVVVSASNAENFISECIDSILSSMLEGVEVLVITDKSEDETENITKWYSEYFKNVHLIECDGIENSTQKAIDKAKGKYIFFVSIYDRLYPDTLKKYYDTAVKTNADIVFSHLMNKDTFGYYPDEKYDITSRTAITANTYLTLVKDMHYSEVFKWNMMYKKGFFEKHSEGFFDYLDSAFIPYIFSYANSVAYIDEPLYEKNVLYHYLVNASMYQDSTDEDIEEFVSEGIKFYLKNGNKDNMNVVNQIAYAQKETFVKEADNDAAFISLEDFIKGADDDTRKKRYENAVKKAKRKQRIIKWVIFGLILAMGIIRIVSLFHF